MLKFFFKSLFLISFLLLVYVLYRSEIYWKGENRNYYFFNYLTLVALIFFFTITLYLNRNIQEYIAIGLISVISTLYLYEGYLYYKNNYSKKRGGGYGKEHIYYDKRTLLEVYYEFIKNNEKITIAIIPAYHINRLENTNNIFPLGGVSDYKTIHCNENGYYSIYHSDRYGFNNPDKEWDGKEIEYLLVGDSFTHGECVNRPNDISSVLRNLSQKKVLNLGYSGNGPLIEYATLREYLKPNVRKVLWVYYEGNDLVVDLRSELKSKLLKRYLDDINFYQNLISKQNQNDILLLEIINRNYTLKYSWYEKPIFKFIKLFDTRSKVAEYFKMRELLNQRQESKNIHQEFKKILYLANDLAVKNNSKLYFVYLPSFNSYKDGKDFEKNKIKKIVNDLNIPFIDIDGEVFKKESNPLKLFPFERYGHYNLEGYTKTALKIYEKTK
jgi:hypothetical protein